MQSRWFDYGGDTIVRADKYIRLASDMASRAGWLFSKIPLTVSNWQVRPSVPPLAPLPRIVAARTER